MINENWLYFNLNGSKSPLWNRKKATCGETVIFLPFGLPFFFHFSHCSFRPSILFSLSSILSFPEIILDAFSLALYTLQTKNTKLIF